MTQPEEMKDQMAVTRVMLDAMKLSILVKENNIEPVAFMLVVAIMMSSKPEFKKDLMDMEAWVSENIKPEMDKLMANMNPFTKPN